mmetsp:Transcript_163418/g.524010  ORF Transcript_163418/g.524010 Transcript_163418/m.524010 type:complete len:240 (-) Transcript_163418:839-1558(-)
MDLSTKVCYFTGSAFVIDRQGASSDVAPNWPPSGPRSPQAVRNVGTDADTGSTYPSHAPNYVGKPPNRGMPPTWVYAFGSDSLGATSPDCLFRFPCSVPFPSIDLSAIVVVFLRPPKRQVRRQLVQDYSVCLADLLARVVRQHALVGFPDLHVAFGHGLTRKPKHFPLGKQELLLDLCLAHLSDSLKAREANPRIFVLPALDDVVRPHSARLADSGEGLGRVDLRHGLPLRLVHNPGDP